MSEQWIAAKQLTLVALASILRDQGGKRCLANYDILQIGNGKSILDLQ